ncbi:LysM domain/BON superfamily protein [Vibrio thalassae]|uniref:LysM domain/BON superfamily protein n=1 Tax=Vibrio thalassae TaxID=1243014 RepID=A0A240EKS8_9VIBR|nr:LysM domain-containing protein [Vibrio thalassae]SNX48833.1 LysM domain/BON superfamily protein [Vibrio thalassae]
MKQVTCLLLTLLSLAPVTFWATQSYANVSDVLKPDAPRHYVVKSGDTLWALSGRYLSSPWRWPELWQQNSHITNPHKIYPGDTLLLIWVAGQPQLMNKRVKHLSPVMTVTRKQPSNTVNPRFLSHYREQERLILESELVMYPQIIGSSRGLDYISQQDEVYIDYQGSEQTWVIYRVGNSYHHDDERFTMREIKRLATARLTKQVDGIAILQLSDVAHELRRGDIAIPISDLIHDKTTRLFEPKTGPKVKDIGIIGMLSSLHFAVQGQTVVLNAGRDASVVQGSSYILTRPSETFIYSGGRQGLGGSDDAPTANSRFPLIEIGRLLVIQSYQGFSVALITEATEPITQQVMVNAPNIDGTMHE